jgi:Nitrile hydratase, alpha chain
VAYSSFPTQRYNIESRVVRRAWADPEYRERLRADPKAALEEELDAKLPDRLTVQLVEERPDMLCIVLPVDTSTIPVETVGVMLGNPPQRR